MSYVFPGVQVYQETASSTASVVNTPTLPCVIVGPAYNVLTYDSSSATSLLTTAATSAVTGTGSMVSGSTTVTLTAVAGFGIGDTIYIPGAGASGATLTTTVVTNSGTTMTVSTAASTSVTNVTITQQALINDPSVDNPFNLPGQIAGQSVELSSIQVYLNNAEVLTFNSAFSGIANSTQLELFYPTGVTGTTTVNSTTVTGITTLGLSEFVVGDTISIAGAGLSGVALTATIESISVEDQFIISTPALTAVTTAAITKIGPSNVNSATSSLNIQAGAELAITYKNSGGSTETFTTTVASVPNPTSTVTVINTVDMLPADFSATTTVTAQVAEGTTSASFASALGFSVGQPVIFSTGGAGGSEFTTTISAISGDTITLSSGPAAAITSGSTVQGLTIANVKVFQTFNNQLLSETNSDSTVNYDTANVILDGYLTIHPYPVLPYGTVYSGSVNIAYSALRTDLSQTMLNLTSVDDVEGQLGNVTQANPLGLGAIMALGGTTSTAGGVNVLAVQSNDLDGYLEAFELLENQNVYAIAVLTQDISIIDDLQSHVDEMSTPENAAWRIGFFNTAIPTTETIGDWNATLVNNNNGNNAITLVSGKYVLTASNATFLSDGVEAGDTVVVTAATGTPSQVGNLEVLNVLSNQQLELQASGTAMAVSYYVSRTLTKAQQAAAVAAVSSTMNDRRMYHVQPDTVGISINSVTTNLPGYYAACVLAGMVAGNYPQQGFTNKVVPNIENVSNSNFYFTKSQIGTIAGAGTLLLVQASSTSSPYVLQQLSTQIDGNANDQELSLVKNIDYLSYYYVSLLKNFIGVYNIVPDTLSGMTSSINSGSAYMVAQTQPKIGAPLLAATIQSLAQSTTNSDQVICTLNATVAYPLNQVLLYLVV